MSLLQMPRGYIAIIHSDNEQNTDKIERTNKRFSKAVHQILQLIIMMYAC